MVLVDGTRTLVLDREKINVEWQDGFELMLGSKIYVNVLMFNHYIWLVMHV